MIQAPPKFVTIFALLFTMGTHAAVTITNAEFVFTLGGDWVSVPSSDTNQFSFESKSNKTSVVLSVMPLSISQDKLVEVAKRFAETRQKAEHWTLGIRRGQGVTRG